jgi:fatty acid desaturase
VLPRTLVALGERFRGREIVLTATIEAAPVDVVAPPDFADLALKVRDAGLLERRTGYYSAKIGLTVAAYGAGFAGLFLVGNSWSALGIAVFLGLMFTQLGFLGHDAGHLEVFRSRSANRLLGLAVGNVLIGMSFGWWVPKHCAHHAHPNEVGRDPDVGDGLVQAGPSDGATGPMVWLAGFLERRQAPLYFPLMLLRSTGIHVSGIQRLLRERNRTAGVEAALLALHASLYLTCVFWVLSPLKGVAFIACQQAVFSVYLGCSFAPNHKGMPLVEPGAELSFAQRQVITARNIRGGPFMDLLLGGLNYQIEHHLFPTMPRPNLTRAQGIVRTFCLANNFGYREDSLFGSYRQTIRYLRPA